ncbi:hypothetical protein [Mesorhizobium sp. L-8-3]|uniref:hypothetical protein n=1 Tax=Mesorhizobium sp. L-8-3 TaxID=2744522 RepID=UPI001926FAB5|nr:hypothetical protein [Mesorhizobium sp. L-8-3]
MLIYLDGLDAGSAAEYECCKWSALTKRCWPMPGRLADTSLARYRFRAFLGPLAVVPSISSRASLAARNRLVFADLDASSFASISRAALVVVSLLASIRVGFGLNMSSPGIRFMLLSFRRKEKRPGKPDLPPDASLANIRGQRPEALCPYAA